jgi:uncharacterized protein YndB with AHSA1/START domain
MPKAVRKVDIRSTRQMTASRDALWDVLGDLTRLPQWLAFADDVTDVSGDAASAPGGSYTVKPKTFYEPQTKWQVTEVEPGRRQLHSSEMPVIAGVRSEIELADAPGGGVEARVHWSGEPKGLMGRMMRPMFQKRIQENWDRSLAELDRVAGGG